MDYSRQIRRDIIPSVEEAALLHRLRAGDEAAFTSLVQQYHTSLVRLARLFVRDQAIADELTQETWLAAIQGLNRFEGRASLKTWLFTILTNKAKTRGQREARTVAFSDWDTTASNSPTVDPHRFTLDSDEERAGHWVEDPAFWRERPEDKFLLDETLAVVHTAIDDLPASQRAVITLRDIYELTSEEACNILEVSETNQRVLLHRARARVRQALEDYLNAEN